MKYLNKIVSFNNKEIYDFIEPDFTPTPPFNTNFDWIGYESMNFLENIGLISLIFIFIAIRQVLGCVFYLMASSIKSCSCLKSKKKLLASAPYVCSNMWLRFFLMTYFEITIACFIGTNIRAFLPQKMTQADEFTLICERISKTLIILFPFIIIVGIWCKIRIKSTILPIEISEEPN